MVRFKNTARPKEAKTIMPAANSREGAFTPILGRALEFGLWFAEDKFNGSIMRPRLENEGALSAVVCGGVAK